MPLGILSKFYVNNGGTYATPLWFEIDLIADMAVNGSWNAGESSVRAGRVVTEEQTNFAIEITGSLRKNIANSGYLAIRTAFLNAVPIDILVLDGARTVVGSDGYRFEGRIFDLSEDQALQAVIFKNFTIRPCAFGASFPPRSALVTLDGGPPTYSAIGGV